MVSTLAGVATEAALQRAERELARAEQDLQRAAASVAEVRATIAEIRAASVAGVEQPQGDGLAPLLVSATEAAAMLGIGRTVLYGLIQQQRIEPVRIGQRGVRFSVDDLRAFVERGGQPERR